VRGVPWDLKEILELLDIGALVVTRDQKDLQDHLVMQVNQVWPDCQVLKVFRVKVALLVSLGIQDLMVIEAPVGPWDSKVNQEIQEFKGHQVLEEYKDMREIVGSRDQRATMEKEEQRVTREVVVPVE